MSDLAAFIATGFGLGMLWRLVIDGVASIWAILDHLIKSI